jgi:hypothetical protein
MNSGELHHLENQFFTKLNRVRKLSKYAKQEIHNLIHEDLSEQEDEISQSKFISMIEQMEILLKETKENWNKYNNS